MPSGGFSSKHAMFSSAVGTVAESCCCWLMDCASHQCHSQTANNTCETGVGYDVWHGWGCSRIASSLALQRQQVWPPGFSSTQQRLLLTASLKTQQHIKEICVAIMACFARLLLLQLSQQQTDHALTTQQQLMNC
jgi:hypothetical protein